MADKEKDQKRDAAQPEEKKPSKLKLILIVVGAVVLLGGGAAAYLKLGHGGEKAADASTHAEAETSAPVTNLELSPFLVNLADPGGRHYLKATLTLELQDQSGTDWVNSRLPRVRDRVLMLLSSKESQELLSGEGKYKLREDILNSINDLMGKKGVQAVYLTEFVVQ